jgi:hypothetical protein
MASNVRVDLKPLDRFAAEVKRDLRSTGNGPVRRAIRQWAARYRSFVQQLFDNNSKGGGGWASLAASTKARRRKARRGRVRGVARSFSILRDTGLLFAALTPTWTRKPGAIQQDIPFGVRAGYGGPARHPGGKASIADIAGFHQTGAGRLPKREIIVDPDQRTLDAMADDMERGLGNMARITGVN